MSPQHISNFFKHNYNQLQLKHKSYRVNRLRTKSVVFIMYVPVVGKRWPTRRIYSDWRELDCRIHMILYDKT